MHQVCYCFYCTIKKWSKLNQKTVFLVHFERFFNCTPLRPDKITYAPIFSQIKRFMEVNNFGESHYCSICDCQVINFQIFLCSIEHPWNVASFRGFLGPFSPKYDPILLKFLPEVVSDKAKQRQFMNSLPKFCLSRNETYPKFPVLVHLWLGQIYPLKTQNVAKSQNFSKSYILRNIK